MIPYKLRPLLFVITVCVASIGLSTVIENGALHFGHASAQTGASDGGVPVLPDASTVGSTGSGSQAGSGSAIPAPADQLAEPVEHPAQALSQWQEAKTHGWPLAILAGLVLVLHGLAYASNAKWVSWLSDDKHASWLAAAATVVSAAFNALVAGGSWYAVATAAGGALFLLKSPQAPQKSAT